ncbi:MAG: GT4 family glycosyltransferase PelF [Spirochaetales bacterium]|nr:GT4 family glycosyltransferase PelF [Spirochaetales bacterium]
MKNKIRVCLLLEGTYPYITGGVSGWIHELIRGLPDIEFVLFTISPKYNQEVRYRLPENIVEHRDIVISKPGQSGKRIVNKKKIFREIVRVHQDFFKARIPELEGLFSIYPEGYFPYNDAVLRREGWEMMVKQNNLLNPVYAFSDYFWAWKSSHDLMFTITGSEIPVADLYHAVSTGYAGLAALIAKIRTGKPFLLTEHGLYHKEREMEIKRALYVTGYQRDMWIKIFNNLSRMSYKYADCIVSLFEINRRKQLEMGAPEKKTIVIPNGIDVGRFTGIKREKRKGFHIGLIGRVVPIKDIKNFILASRIISEMIPDAFFYCIGPIDEDPGYFEECRKMVESFRLTEQFVFTGRQDVTAYYSFLNVICLTSVREAQPLVILEAFCAGVPIVSTKVGNIPELLDYDDRFLASSKDPGMIAHCVKFIYDNPHDVEELVSRNREKILKFYNRDEVHKRYGTLYARLTGKL